MRDLANYFEDLLNILAAAPAVISYVKAPSLDAQGYQEGILSFAVRYADSSSLHVQMWADCSRDQIDWIIYRFHYQDSGAVQRFRFDNAPHYPQLPNFPHHVHVGPDGAEELYPFGPPNVRQVAQIVEWHLAHPGAVWNPRIDPRS